MFRVGTRGVGIDDPNNEVIAAAGSDQAQLRTAAVSGKFVGFEVTCRGFGRRLVATYTVASRESIYAGRIAILED